jgi:hypothetical protein
MRLRKKLATDRHRAMAGCYRPRPDPVVSTTAAYRSDRNSSDVDVDPSLMHLNRSQIFGLPEFDHHVLPVNGFPEDPGQRALVSRARKGDTEVPCPSPAPISSSDRLKWPPVECRYGHAVKKYPRCFALRQL